MITSRWTLILALLVALPSFPACDDAPADGDGDGDADGDGDGDADGDGDGDADGDADGDGDGDADGDGDGDGDADGDGDGDPPATGHESYVPEDLRPTSAARIIVLGDSISTGTGASSPSRSYYALLDENDDSRYPDEADTDLTSFFGGDIEVVNVARNGAVTADLSGQCDRLEGRLDLPVAGHSIVVMTIGGNDLQQLILSPDPSGPPLDAAVERIVTTFEWFDETRFPDGVSFYVAAVYDPSDGEARIDGCFFNLHLPQLVEALDAWRLAYIEAGMAHGFAVVDALGHFHGHGHNHDHEDNPFYDELDPTLWFDDCIHPNDLGHNELRRLFYEAIDPSYVAD